MTETITPTVRAIVDKLSDPHGGYRSNLTPPSEIYTNDEFFHFEQKVLFSKEWVCVGRESNLPTSGDNFTVDIAGEPVIVVRNEEGHINAMSAVCRHRGACVTMPNSKALDRLNDPSAYLCGNVKAFRCPYHWWTYDLNGQLKGAPAMGRTPGFSIKDVHLPMFKTEVWHGFIMVNLDPEAKSLMQQTNQINDILERYDASNLVSVCPDNMTVPFNWKIFFDNSIDHYHASRLHAGLHDIAPSSGLTVDPLDLESAVTCGWLELAERDAAFTATGKVMFPVIPGIPEKCHDKTFFASVLPNLMIFGQSDMLIAFILHPLTTCSYKFQMIYLVPNQTAVLPDMEVILKDSKRRLLDITEQDMGICASVQRGVQSPYFQQGRFSWQEEQLVDFHRLLCSRYKAALG